MALIGAEPAGQSQRIGQQSDDWVTINKDYSSQRYVDLDQINASNVGKLKEVCEIQLNEPVWFTSGLLKVNRTLYVTTLRGTYAFDAATCDLQWRYVVDFKQNAASSTQRGAGYLDGRIFRGTGDGRVIALDATMGNLLWDVQAADPTKHEAFSSAPIAMQGRVYIGIVTSDLGVAGRLMAFDAPTGTQLWNFDTTLGKHFGGGFWTTYSADTKTAEIFAGVANPFPDFNRDIVPGDPEFTAKTNSVISIDATSISQAHLKWFYQPVPSDEHDWDLAAAPTLYRTTSGKNMLAIAGKGGVVYGIDRATHQRVFSTPGTTVVPNPPLDATWKLVCPGLIGGALFNGTAFSPGTGMLFAGMTDHCAFYTKNSALPGGGSVVKDWSTAAKLIAPAGWITALDGATGRVIWQNHTNSQVQAGLVTTKSGLLFGGESNGTLFALDAKTGSLLKSLDVGGAINNGLISYQAGGLQYVAAAIGGTGENPHASAGPLRVSVFGLRGSGSPRVVQLDRLAPAGGPGVTASVATYIQVCTQCHGRNGGGSSAPSLTRQSQLADPALLKQFLQTVPPPMPRLYPGLLGDQDVELIEEYLQSVVFKCGQPGGESCQLPGQPSTGGTNDWQAIYSVLTSPRCLNCHPGPTPNAPSIPGWPAGSSDYPRQADDRHPHYYGVVRGPETGTNGQLTGTGAPYGRCDSCHGVANDPRTGIPGAVDSKGNVDWRLAPTGMAWETSAGVPMTGTQLCAQLTNPAKNGNRGPQDLLQHIETEPLVLWGWSPGTQLDGTARSTPPLSHEEFVNVFQSWINAGSPCPTGSGVAHESKH